VLDGPEVTELAGSRRAGAQLLAGGSGQFLPVRPDLGAQNPLETGEFEPMLAVTPLNPPPSVTPHANAVHDPGRDRAVPQRLSGQRARHGVNPASFSPGSYAAPTFLRSNSLAFSGTLACDTSSNPHPWRSGRSGQNRPPGYLALTPSGKAISRIYPLSIPGRTTRHCAAARLCAGSGPVALQVDA